MQTTVDIECPHCQKAQTKQISVISFEDRFKIGQVFTCEAINDKGCDKDFTIYYRAHLEVKTKPVCDFPG